MLDWLRCTVTHSSVGGVVADPDGDGEELADGLLAILASSVAEAVAVADRLVAEDVADGDGERVGDWEGDASAGVEADAGVVPGADADDEACLSGLLLAVAEVLGSGLLLVVAEVLGSGLLVVAEGLGSGLLAVVEGFGSELLALAEGRVVGD